MGSAGLQGHYTSYKECLIKECQHDRQDALDWLNRESHRGHMMPYVFFKKMSENRRIELLHGYNSRHSRDRIRIHLHLTSPQAFRLVLVVFTLLDLGNSAIGAFCFSLFPCFDAGCWWALRFLPRLLHSDRACRQDVCRVEHVEISSDDVMADAGQV